MKKSTQTLNAKQLTGLLAVSLVMFVLGFFKAFDSGNLWVYALCLVLLVGIAEIIGELVKVLRKK